ncbi:MAG: hypothetical protein IJ773_08405 [Lachnospiraceae bacterium]|nr:hypothetical protein [Lachnospiraceae bacterium]
MKRKSSAGLFFTVLSLILAVAGAVLYYLNTTTAYFASQGLNTTILIVACAAVVVQLIYLIVGMKGTPAVNDLFPIIATALLIAAAVLFASARVNGIAALITFEGNETTTMALYTAIGGIIALVAAALVNILGSFFDVSKEV